MGYAAEHRIWPLLIFTVASLSLFWLRTPVESLIGTSLLTANTKVERRTALVASPWGYRPPLRQFDHFAVIAKIFMLVLAEWFESHPIPVTLLDLDTENQSCGSLKHYFDGQVTNVIIHTAAGLDVFVDDLAEGGPIILADMGASPGKSLTSGSTACSRTWRLPG